MTLLQFQVFLAVVETKSFTKAGEYVGLTQSGVSQTMAGLESELGITLLNRSRNGVTLTETGERILIHIREIMNRTSLIKHEVAAMIGIEVGTLRIGSIPSVSAKLLPGIIGSFKNRYPGIELVLFEGSYEEVNKWITSSVIDIGMVTLPSEGYESIPLLQDKMIVFLPANHPLKNETSLQLYQISSDPFIMPKADCEIFIKDIFRSNGIVPNIHFEVRDTATILAMVQEGVGVTILPEMAIPTSLPKVSASYLLPQAYRNVGLGMRSLKSVSPAATAFINESQQFVKDLSFKLFNSYQSYL